MVEIPFADHMQPAELAAADAVLPAPAPAGPHVLARSRRRHRWPAGRERTALNRAAAAAGRSWSGAVRLRLRLRVGIPIRRPVRARAADGHEGSASGGSGSGQPGAGQVADHFDAHRAHQRRLASVERRPMDDLPERSHDALRSTGLEELHRPERPPPVAEQLLELGRGGRRRCPCARGLSGGSRRPGPASSRTP